MMSQSEVVYLNGEYPLKSQATLSILDRGFLFGDGVYELIPIHHKKIFYMEDHFLRLKKSLELINVDPIIIDNIDFEKIINSLIDSNGFTNHFIYIHISRGVDKSRNHIYQKNCEPTILVMGENYQPFSREIIEEGKVAILEDDYRWLKSNIKSTSLLANVLIKNKASDNDAYEALLIRDGFLTEGSASNVFIVKDNIIKTPILSNKLLPGITRKFLTDLIGKYNYDFSECEISKKDVLDSDEIFCSSSTNPVVPIIKIDKKLISKKAGALTMKLYSHAQDYIKDLHT